jgi:tyrosine-protein kinase
LLDYLDDTLKTPDDVKRVSNVPVIGYIGETKETENGKGKLYVSNNPRSPVTEAYRTLRTNLHFLGEHEELKSILITSTSVGAGKTSVAANLAAVIAQGGKEVVLVDADLRRPRVHEIFDVPNDYGLSNIFLNGLDVDKAIKLIKTEHIKFISSGNVPPNPAEILASEDMDKILVDLESRADYVLVDSPPLIISDALSLASKVDGVLIVIQPGQSRRKAVHSMLEQFERAGARVLGIVLNKVPRSTIFEYGGYYSSYYSANGNSSPTSMRTQVEKDQKGYSGYLEKVQASIGKLFRRTDF